MFADMPLSESQTFVMLGIATAVIVYPIILFAIGALGYCQSNAESKA